MVGQLPPDVFWSGFGISRAQMPMVAQAMLLGCSLYTSDAADDTPCVDLGGRRIIKKKKVDDLT